MAKGMSMRRHALKPFRHVPSRRHIEHSAGSRIQEIILLHVTAELRRNFAQLRAGRRACACRF
jgi:hypothetical protein